DNAPVLATGKVTGESPQPYVPPDDCEGDRRRTRRNHRRGLTATKFRPLLSPAWRTLTASSSCSAPTRPRPSCAGIVPIASSIAGSSSPAGRPPRSSGRATAPRIHRAGAPACWSMRSWPAPRRPTPAAARKTSGRTGRLPATPFLATASVRPPPSPLGPCVGILLLFPWQNQPRFGIYCPVAPHPARRRPGLRASRRPLRPQARSRNPEVTFAPPRQRGGEDFGDNRGKDGARMGIGLVRGARQT